MFIKVLINVKKIREQGRERQRKHREKLKTESEKSNVTVTLGNAEEEKKNRRDNKKKKVKKRIEEKEDKMVSENIVLTKVINKNLKNGFCNRELKPIDLIIFMKMFHLIV